MPRLLRAEAFAKINLTLRVLGRRQDGYHEVRTILQSLALHDTLAFGRRRGEFAIECDDPSCPTDRANLVWRAADEVWRAGDRRGQPRDVVVRISKRIPMQSGLGGGSSDAAAAIRGLSHVWKIELSEEDRHAVAARLGADVPFFLRGGTSLGIDRGDVLFPLADYPETWVTVAIPGFGVSTQHAYEWFDSAAASFPEGERAGVFGLPPAECINDLQGPVAARHPAITRIVAALRRAGATFAAMSGSGSAVFGLFESRTAGLAAGRTLATAGCRTIVTRTLNRDRFQAGSRVTTMRASPRGGR